MEEQNTPTETIPEVTIEPSTAPKNGSFIIVLLSILLLISCAIAGFFAYQSQNLVGEIVKLRTELSQTVIVEELETPIPEISEESSSEAKLIDTEDDCLTKPCPTVSPLPTL